MLARLRTILRALGRESDAASASGAILARLREFLENRLTATFLSRIDVAVSTMLSTTINSVQQGSTAIPSGSGTSTTSTITSVNTAKSHIEQNGNASDDPDDRMSVELTNATTVTCRRGISNPGVAHTMRWTVVEDK